jgi:hypothetical protein
MFEFLLADANIPFATALALVMIIALFEGVGAVVGAGLGSVLDGLVPSFELDADVEVGEVGSNHALSRLLGWLRVGKVPVLMLLVVFLFSFACAGYALNLAALETFGLFAPVFVSVPLAVLAAVFSTRVGGGALQFVLPKDETSSVSLNSLIGREAFITIGESTSTSSAEARVRDQFGQTHYIMVRAEEGYGPFLPGEALLLVRRSKDQFIAIAANHSVMDE